MDAPDPEPVAHTFTIEFGRFLAEEELRTVVDQVKAHVPHVQRLRVDLVTDSKTPDERVHDAIVSLSPWLAHHAGCARVTDAAACTCGLQTALQPHGWSV